MGNEKPFQRAFICAAVLYVIIMAILVLTGAQNLSYRIGYVFSTCLFPALATGIWAYNSKSTWSWGRFAATVIGFYLLFAYFAVSGRNQ